MRTRGGAAFLVWGLFAGCGGTRIPPPPGAGRVEAPVAVRAEEDLEEAGALPKGRAGRKVDPGGAIPDFSLEAMTGMGSEDRVLGRGKEGEIRAHHLLDRLAERDPKTVAELLELCRLDQAVRAFAERHRIFVPKEDLRLALRSELARLERRFRREGRVGLSFEDWVSATFGEELPSLRRRIALLAWRRGLRAYALRYAQRRGGILRLRIFVGAAEEARKAREKIAAGADFRVVARASSVHPSGPAGGLLRWLPLSGGGIYVRLAKGVPAGALSPLLPFPSTQLGGKERGSGRFFAFVRVLERTLPDPRPFSEVWPEIQKDLARRPIRPEDMTAFLLKEG